MLPVRIGFGLVVIALLPLSALGQAPSIVMRSPSASAIAGQPISFSVATSGNPAPSYQWQEYPAGGNSWSNLSDGNGLSGSVTPTLAISAATTAMSGDQFRMVATNGSGSLPSTPVTLTVTPFPTGDAVEYSFSTLAGEVGVQGYVYLYTGEDGTGSGAQFVYPSGMAADITGNVYVADTGSSNIRKITPAGVVTTLAGTPGVPGSGDGTGGSASFNTPFGVAVDLTGNVYVADTGNSTIRKITPAGVVTTLAGTAGEQGSANGTGSAAQFYFPQGVAVDAAGNVYVADTYNQTIRKITPVGVVTTLAGTVNYSGSNDGTGGAAQFNFPIDLAVDLAGNVYVSDSGNTIRKVTPLGAVTTLAGSAGVAGSSDGTGSAAQFNQPGGLGVDNAGNVYVADTGNSTIRKVTPAGVVTTLGGTPGLWGTMDGTGALVQFNSPYGLAVDDTGKLYVSDSGNYTIREGIPTAVAPITIVTNPASAVVNSGQNVMFQAAASSLASLNYQWQMLGVGAENWTNLADAGEFSGTATTTLIITGASGDLNGAQFRCVASNSGTSAASSPALLTVNYLSQVAPSPSTTVIVGQPVSFSAGGIGYPAPSYQWQESTDGGSTWTNLSDGNGFSGTGSSNVVISAATTAMSGEQFRAVATNGSGSVTSSPVTLTVATLPPNPVIGYDFITLAGIPPIVSSGSADGTGIAARFWSPEGVAVDGAGNAYVADTRNSTIRKITPAGVVTTLAGNPNIQGNADGTGSGAQFSEPTGVAVDSAGNVYVADTRNCTIRKITPAGVVTTLAGSSRASGLAGNAGSANGIGSAALFNNPNGLAVDGAGNVYVADSGNNMIRKITPAGVVTTFAGKSDGGSADGTGVGAQFSGPKGVAVDAAGDVYVADSGNGTIRKITPAGAVTTLAGSPPPPPEVSLIEPPNGEPTWADGTGSAARFNDPSGVAVDSAGNVYVADTGNNMIRKVTPAGVVTTLDGSADSLNIGSEDGSGTAAHFNEPYDIAVDSSGNLYVADALNNTIRKITPAGAVATLAGIASAGNRDGIGTAAQFYGPNGVAVDGAGTVYVADSGTDTIRKIDSSGNVATVAGSPGVYGHADGVGSAAQFAGPSAVAVDGAGNLYVADAGNSTIRKITPAGIVTTLAGLPGVEGTSDGTGNEAQFSAPEGVAVDGVGNVYVADTGNNTIRKITPAGVVTTLAGTPGANTGGGADGTGGAAQFETPEGLTVDSAGTVYVTDTGNCTIRKVTPTGIVTTFAGSTSTRGTVDGTGSAAGFSAPSGGTVDGAGNVYVSDVDAIRKITPAGVVTTLAGISRISGDADGIGGVARFFGPVGTAVDGAGNVYVADSGNNTIRKGFPVVSAWVDITTQPASQTLTAGGSATLAVAATGGASPTYQWQFDGTSIPGASSSTLALPNIGTTQAGTYSVVVTSAGDSTVSTAATVAVTSAAWLTNISARAYVAPSLGGDDVLIVGLNTAGPASKSVLVRGAGPALPQLDVPDFLVHPSLTFYTGSNADPVVTGWPPGLASLFTSLGAFPFAVGSNDTAVLKSLNPGGYTAIVNSTDGGDGVALAEIYDADQGAPVNRLVNLSARALVGTGEHVLIGGFAISGSSSETVLIRAVGPGLVPMNVAGTLAHPLLQLYDGNPGNSPNGPQVIASNFFWGALPTPGSSIVAAGLQPATATIMTAAGAFSLPEPYNGVYDAAMVVTLPPGNYTALVSGNDGGSGIALFEIYELP